MVHVLVLVCVYNYYAPATTVTNLTCYDVHAHILNTHNTIMHPWARLCVLISSIVQLASSISTQVCIIMSSMSMHNTQSEYTSKHNKIRQICTQKHNYICEPAIAHGHSYCMLQSMKHAVQCKTTQYSIICTINPVSTVQLTHIKVYFTR